MSKMGAGFGRKTWLERWGGKPLASKMRNIYKDRRLTDGLPLAGESALKSKVENLDTRPDDRPRIERLLTYLDRLIDLSEGKKVLVLGCGPKPQTLDVLREKKYEVVGVEPSRLYAQAAAEYLNSSAIVLQGAAEDIPVEDNSQHLIFLESVLEHVDSPLIALKEVYRVLAPGGIAFVITTNRHRVSLIGFNGEYRTRFYNWFPPLVKECYVFHQLHYDPSLANFSERPAVHWYSFADLCSVGRMAGFAKFYSILDLVDPDDPSIRKSKLRVMLINMAKFNPWLRALILSQIGGTIIMLKRPA